MSETGFTSLILAAAGGHLEVVKTLVEKVMLRSCRVHTASMSHVVRGWVGRSCLSSGTLSRVCRSPCVPKLAAVVDVQPGYLRTCTKFGIYMTTNEGCLLLQKLVNLWMPLN